MSKVIQSFIHLVLHRGLEVISKDLFLFKLIPRAINISHGVIPRYSGTFLNRYISKSKIIRVIGFTTSFSFILLTILSVFPIINHEESVEATYTPANPPTVTITSSSNIASVDITPTSSDGTFASSTSASEVAFGVTTDNLTGYTVAVSARSGDTLGQLTNASYGDTLDTISTITSETDFSTNSTYTNQWGIKPSKYVDTSTGTVIDNTSSTINYLPAPTTSELVLDTTNTPNPTTANNYTIGLGARVDYTKPVGTYTNTYVLQAVGNQISYQINYSDTTSDTTVADIPSADGANDIEASGFTLSSTVPTRTGYTFAGWCDGIVSHVASGNSTCAPNTTTGAPGTTYLAGASYTFTALSTGSMNTADLYAMWDVNTYSLTIAFGSYVASVSVRSGSTSGTIIKTINSSDSNKTVTGLTYGIAYYLTATYSSTYRYSSSSLSGSGTLSWPNFTVGAGNSTITVNGRATTFNDVYNTTGTKYMQSMTSTMCANVTNGQTSTLRDNRDNQDYTVAKINGNCWMTKNIAIGCSGNSRVARSLTSSNSNVSSTWSTGSAGALTSGDSNTEARMQCSSTYGGWYNYVAATANTIKTDSAGTASYSICPLKWRLPTWTEFKTILNYRSQFNPIAGGSYIGGQITDTGLAGWWASTPSGNAGYRERLRYNSSDNSLYWSQHYRYFGEHVRCIAQ
ncbi:MAG: hypothetical protein Q4F58_01290 [Candidatus Saccharibacteria bacterium]|nr:hypothetical protein [Candidatus Saccharibacteria bacterium]